MSYHKTIFFLQYRRGRHKKSFQRALVTITTKLEKNWINLTQKEEEKLVSSKSFVRDALNIDKSWESHIFSFLLASLSFFVLFFYQDSIVVRPNEGNIKYISVGQKKWKKKLYTVYVFSDIRIQSTRGRNQFTISALAFNIA